MKGLDNHRCRFPRRRAVALAAVLIVLTLVIGVTGALVCTLAVENRQLRSHDDQLQALWLVEAGLQRAAAQLDAAPDYDGETWVIPAEQLDGRLPGRVEIRIETAEDDADRRVIAVTADYPDDPLLRKRSSRRIGITRTPQGDAS